MKKTWLSRFCISAALIGTLLANTTAGLVSAANTPDEYHDDWLHVNENAEIVDMDGNPVWLTGCNWFGYNVGSQVFDGVWSRNMHEMLQEIADHGFNFLRVPMSTEILLQWKNGDPDPATPKVNQYSNPELTLEGVEGGTIMYSFDIWNKAVEWCRELGIKIMIDIHCAETASAGHQISLWYTDKFSTEDWFEALEWFADYYKDDDTILAIDLKNEPHGTADVPDQMAKWDDSKDPTNWKYAAETAAAKVLAINPELLIMVEGTEVYPKFEEGADWTSLRIDYTTMYEYYHHTWWGGCFCGAKDYPIDLGEHQDQLVYSPHDYGPLVWTQEWFYDGFTQETLLEDCWYDNWFFIQDTGMAPLLMGEWGGFLDEEHDKDGKNRAWMTYLRDFMIENRIHHTFWCFNENSGDTGGLVYDNFGTWDEVKYNFVLPSLWKTEDGTFIGLDHKIPLGKNGITVAEYYGAEPQPTQPTKPTEPDETKPTEGKTEPTEGKTEPSEKETKPTSAPDTKAVYGDVNLDGDVDILDIIVLNRALLGAASLSDDAAANADVDKDKKPTPADSLNIMKYLVGLIAALPVK